MKRFGWRLLQALFAGPSADDGDPVPDGDLLKRFAQGDSAAFELLVYRHAKAVFGTCARICRDMHDAEDAFQATFLVLARKATSVRRTSCLAGWLHRVAQRAATRAAVRRTKMQRREQSITVDPPAQATTDDLNDLRAVLDAEINRLADHYRLPVLLCYLNGLSTEAAAKQLGIPRGTVLSRLATARQKLAARLSRRGVTVPATAAGLIGLGELGEPQTVSAALVAATARSIAIRPTSIAASALAREVLHMIAWKTTAAWAMIFVAMVGLGGGVWALTAGGDGPPQRAQAPEKAMLPKADQAKEIADAPRGAVVAKAEDGAVVAKAEDLVLKTDDARIEAEKRELAKKVQIERLRSRINDFQKDAHELRQEHQALKQNAGYPPYDPKVLVETIAKIDAERLMLEVSWANEDQKAVVDQKLKRLDERRKELVRRLETQEIDKTQRTLDLERLEREMLRVERLSTEFRTRLEYLKLDLAPLPFPIGIDPTLERLLNEVADLKKEVQKMAESRK
jgi:RNA polymerase sigma factor (sigma-70 family)